MKQFVAEYVTQYFMVNVKRKFIGLKTHKGAQPNQIEKRGFESDFWSCDLQNVRILPDNTVQ